MNFEGARAGLYSPLILMDSASGFRFSFVLYVFCIGGPLLVLFLFVAHRTSQNCKSSKVIGLSNVKLLNSFPFFNPNL